MINVIGNCCLREQHSLKKYMKMYLFAFWNWSNCTYTCIILCTYKKDKGCRGTGYTDTCFFFFYLLAKLDGSFSLAMIEMGLCNVQCYSHKLTPLSKATFVPLQLLDFIEFQHLWVIWGQCCLACQTAKSRNLDLIWLKIYLQLLVFFIELYSAVWAVTSDSFLNVSL